MDKETVLILVLVVSDSLVNSILYSFAPEGEEGLTLLAVGKKQSWQGGEEEFKKAAIASIDACLRQKEGERKWGQLIFIVSPFWVINEEKIIETKEKWLKEICQHYSLPPGGFVIDDEAIVNFYREKEEGLPSFIILSFAAGELRLSLVYLGEIKRRLKLNIEGELTPERVEEGLLKMDFEGILPPQIIAWGEISSRFEEEAMDYPWVEKEKEIFLHLPEIKVLSWPEVALVFKGIIADQIKKKGRIAAEVMVDKPPLTKTDSPESAPALPSGFSYDDLASIEKEEEGGKEKIEKGGEVVDQEKREKKRKTPLAAVFSWGRAKISQWRERLTLGRGERGGRWGKRLALVLGGGGGIFLALLFFFLRVEVSLFVTPKPIEGEMMVELRPGANLNFEKGIIPVEEISLNLEKKAKGEASGSKLIGEKAKGKVVVFNRTSKSEVFKKGTVILGPGELAFIFTEEIKVASKTPDLVSGVDRWGEAEVAVAAEKIGSQYNLAKNTIFTIKGYSGDSFLVKNKEDFSGGTSREILAVSQEDLDKVKKKLEEESRSEAQKKLLEKAGEGKKVIEGTFSLKTVSFETSKKAGEEGESFEAKLVTKATVLLVSQEDIAGLSQNLLREKIGQDFVLRLDSVEAKFSPEKSEKGFWRGNLKVKAKTYPQFDEAKIKKEIAGHRKEIARERLKQLPRVYRYSFNFKPSWGEVWPWLPWRKENIKVIIRG